MAVRGGVSARLVTLIALTGSPARVSASLPSPTFEADASLFGVELRPGASEFTELTWRPRFTDVREFVAADYRAEHAGTDYQVTRCRTARVVVPMAGDLLMVDLEVRADAPGLILAKRDSFDPAGAVRIGDVGLLAAAFGDAAVVGEPGSVGDDDLRRSGLRRQILFLPADAGRQWFGDDPESLDAAQARLLRQFMFKDTDIYYRPALAPVRVPPDMNGPDAQLVFVWDCNTVVCGLDAYPQLTGVRMLGVTMSNCQALGALKRCVEIRDEAVLATAWESGPVLSDVEERRAALELRLRRARELGAGAQRGRRDAHAGDRCRRRPASAWLPRGRCRGVTAAADARCHPTVAVPVGRVEPDRQGSARRRRGTGESARKQLSIAESTRGLLRQTEAFKAASLVVATIAIVLSIASLFVSAAAVPADQGSDPAGVTRAERPVRRLRTGRRGHSRCRAAAGIAGHTDQRMAEGGASRAVAGDRRAARVPRASGARGYRRPACGRPGQGGRGVCHGAAAGHMAPRAWTRFEDADAPPLDASGSGPPSTVPPPLTVPAPASGPALHTPAPRSSADEVSSV